jgi:hypothetical protein
LITPYVRDFSDLTLLTADGEKQEEKKREDRFPNPVNSILPIYGGPSSVSRGTKYLSIFDELAFGYIQEILI